MRLIKDSKAIENSERFSQEVQNAVKAWCNVVKKARWKHLDEIRGTYGRSVDKVENFLVFNIKSYRLITGVNFEKQVIYYKYLLTHDEYDAEKWKNNPYFKRKD